MAASKCTPYPRVKVSFSLSPDDPMLAVAVPAVRPIRFKYVSLSSAYHQHYIVRNKFLFRFHSREEEIAQGAAFWLWDYLRRSSLSGFFLPLSGGIDSSSVGCIVFSMCRQVGDNMLLSNYFLFLHIWCNLFSYIFQSVGLSSNSYVFRG